MCKFTETGTFHLQKAAVYVSLRPFMLHWRKIQMMVHKPRKAIRARIRITQALSRPVESPYSSDPKVETLQFYEKKESSN